MDRSAEIAFPAPGRDASLLRRAASVAGRGRVGAAALIVVLVFVFLAVASPLIAPDDPNAQDYDALLSSPSLVHPMGTDQVGRDVLSRVIYGSRVSLSLGFTAVVVALAIGVPLGLVAGYVGGAVDNVVMRVVDAFIALPSIILALAIVAVLKPTLFNVTLAIGITYFPLFARLIRSDTLSLRERDFIHAARATGASDGRIMLRHILPNTLSPIIVQTTLAIGFAILAEASLSYLGAGVQPPTPSWGNAINQGAALLQQAPWLSIFPGVTIFILVLAFNLLGDALRDQLDPRLRGR
jgi:peptide/nickel transport system permease protein